MGGVGGIAKNKTYNNADDPNYYRQGEACKNSYYRYGIGSVEIH